MAALLVKIASAPVSASVPTAPVPLAALRNAGQPFDDADADLVLRSADGVDFRVHRLFLRKAFDFFDGMFVRTCLSFAISSYLEERVRPSQTVTGTKRGTACLLSASMNAP
jgi:hypothetical protein